MKIKIGEKVYLQKYDIARLMQSHCAIPSSLFAELFLNNEVFFVNGTSDAWRFDCVFEQPENVEWLMGQDWIVDYDKYVVMAISDLEKLADRIDLEQPADMKELDENRHKVSSIHTLVAAIRGEIVFVYPEGYKEPFGSQATAKPAKKPGFFARLFGRRKSAQ